MAGRNILLAGVPRSGTTLTCHLLNKIPDFVALHEPMQPGKLAKLSSEEIVSALARFFEAQRTMIRNESRASSKSYRGAVPSNPLSDEVRDGKRIRLIDGDTIEVGNVKSSDFDLAVKHPAFFSACLPFLVNHFECFAVIRNPLAVLLSWQTAGMSVSSGKFPTAEVFDPDLKAMLSEGENVLDRQVLLLDYLFQRYAKWLPGRILRYENLVTSGGRALTLIAPMAVGLNENLSSRNTRTTSSAQTRALADALLKSSGAYWDFYSHSDVTDLIQ